MTTPPAVEPVVAPGLLITGAPDREAVLVRLAHAAASPCGAAAPRIFDALLAREEKMPTATPGGVAFPHALLPEVVRAVIVPAVLRPGVSFGAGAERTVDVAFAVVGPASAQGHLQTLARLARVCRDASAMAQIRAARTGHDVGAALAASLGPGSST